MIDIFTRLQEMSKTAIESTKQHNDTSATLLKDAKEDYDVMEDGVVKTSCGIQLRATAAATLMVKNDLAEMRGEMRELIASNRTRFVEDATEEWFVESVPPSRIRAFLRCYRAAKIMAELSNVEYDQKVDEIWTRSDFRKDEGNLDLTQPLRVTIGGEPARRKKYMISLQYLINHNKWEDAIYKRSTADHEAWKASQVKGLPSGRPPKK